ncbi:hypothetical protein ACIBCM_27745 [Streptomyces sp. NPDC051018]|uniref:hypothetical protein n=1 Tax=Streptomyces sp. NPDC051018 TaxID=3365639 RepID=UPI0037A69E4F
MRNKPSPNGVALGLLSPRDWVRATKKSGHWYKVTTNTKTTSGLKEGTSGWVRSRHLKPETCMQIN